MRGRTRSSAVLLGAMLASFVLVSIYVIATRGHGLTGDQVLYNEYGRLFTEGKLWYATVPFGVEHPSAWKAPASAGSR
jgi:hypothetical protein